MSYRVTQENILLLSVDAVAISVELELSPSETPLCQAVAAAGGESLREALIACRHFLPVGSAMEMTPGELPCAHLILTAVPVWASGKSNELLILHRCYKSVFQLAESLGCESIALPFLGAMYYRFPRHEAVKIALAEAEKCALEVVFVADTPELYAISQKPYRKPEIVSYVGYYRDHAIFELDNGLFARVDIRPEIVDVTPIAYFEACFRTGNNPLQPPLPAEEIARLRQIYAENDW